MKEFLSREGVAFTAKNVDEDDRAYDELIARGFRTVPLTIVGERAVKGYDPAALKSAIAGRSGDH
ncbi:MAG: NrdH-redoxin [Acidobacteria bacterium]|nr:MAG: NrdH-redoxin [Acidobacteriota bacterium]